MQALLLFLAATISFFYIVSWGVRRAISWLFYTKYHISLKIGRIGIPYLRLCDIEINKNGFSVHIDEISVRSSLISSDVTKLLTLIVRDVRINKDVGGHSPDLLAVASQNGDPPLDFRDKKIPHFINTFAQFMAVQVYNISVNLLRSETPGCLTHATASELRFDASILKNAKFLLVTLNLTEACTKVLRHAEEQQKESCLAEFKFGVSTEIILVARGPLSVEKLDVRMSQTEAIVNDSFYEMAQSRATQSGAGDPKGQEELYVRFFPLIPKNCTLHIEDTLLKGVKETGQIEYNSSLKKLQLNYKTVSTVEEKSPLPPASSPHMLLNFSLSDLQLQNTREKLIALKTLTVDAKLKNYTVDIYFQLNALMVTYNHDVIHRWVYGNFLKNRHCQHRHRGHHQRQARPLKLAKTTVSSSDKNDFAVDLMKKLVVNACAEFSKVSVNVKLSGHDSSVGFNHVKLMLEQSREYRGISYPVYLLELLLHQRHWQMEFLVESFWWSFKEWNQDSNVSTKTVHIWGTPVYFVKVLVKLWTCDNDEIKVLSILDTVQLEWSLELVDYVLLAIKCLKQYGGTSVGQEGVAKKKVIEQQRASPQFTFNTGIKHLNCFFQSQNTEYFVGQLKAIEALKTSTSSDLQFKEFKIFTINNTGAYYSCIRSDDIANYKVLVRQAHWETVDDGAVKKKSLNLLDGAKMFWSPNLHLKALILFKEMAEFVMEIKEELGLNFGGDDVVDVGRARNEVKSSFSCRVASTIVFHMEMSEEHSAKVSVDALNFCKRGEDDVRVQNSRTVVAIDGADIFTVKGVELRTVEDHQLIREERLDNDNFVLEWNRTWWLSLDLFKAVFPYEHRYADAVQDELISIFKWLKVVHNVKRTPYTKHSPLPSDLLINVKEFLFEMSDDPFEVRLRDNFELLEDEYNESLKRQKMLKERIGQLLKTHLHLPAGKVEELYSNLKRKNADIYVMRSKQMLKAAPPRTTLFAWNMTSVELMILCDPSIHGTDNVAEIMKEIDGDSPWPEEGIEFSTLWCRVVSLRCKEWKFQLRDFPQPLLDIRQCYICGQLVGAEQLAPRRAIRDAVINLGEPFEPFTVERGMLPLKFYHDLNCEVESFSYAFGPCWEPVIAQCNLSFEKIAPPSRDPSPPLSFWDKMRLLWHGRLTMLVQQLTVLLHASLDPYNTTEEMELTWSQVVMDWTNAKFVFKGDLNIFVRTASKYDDCQLLHLPNVKLILGIGWVCLGDPNDHHGVIQCAPDKVPEYSSHQVHDSFRAFRSQNVNLSIVMETKAPNNQSPLSSARLGNTASAPADNNTSGNSSSGGGAPLLDCPMLVLYGSTLRWIENLKLILSGVTRPTRRGRIFGNVRPKKTQLSRHYRKVHLLMGLHKFHVCYWMSFAMQRGCELIGGRLSSSSEHTLSLVAVDDGLKHRPKAEWSIVYMNSELNDSEIWLKSSLDSGGDSCSETEVPFAMMSLRGQPVEKCYCLSVAKVSYGREALLNLANHVVAAGAGAAAAACDRNKDTTPTHRLVVYDLRGAWTKSNRNVAVALFDTFMKNKQMKKNLSTEALKGFRKDSNTTPLKRRSVDASTPPNSSIQASVLQGAAAAPNTTSATAAAAASSASAAAQDQVSSPISKLQSGHAVNMLQQLIAEADNKSVVYSDDLSSVTTRQQHLQGLQACQEDDVQHKNWQITLVNAQVLLKGCETKGYVILSAAKAEILQRIHRPVWKERTLVSKTTWVGTLECMQYYATVNAGENDSNVNENIMWLTVDNIQEKESTEISEEPSEVPNMVGSGVSVGAVVSDTVGPSDSSQLQRIVSRCKCEFFYAGYGDISVDPEAVGGVMGELPPPPQEEVGPWDWGRRYTAVDAFTLMHHDLDVCTNSLQYAMLLDVVNNLLLHVEPHRKEALERLARMRFQLQLHSVEDQRRPIQNQQTLVRTLVSKLRRLEKETYLVSKLLAENSDDLEQIQEMDRLEKLVYECKNQLNVESEELDMMLSCYKESQLLANSRMALSRSDKPPTIVRANEICFKHAQWRLTEADGQIGIADLVLSNFLYTKNSKSDDSVEHLLELGYLRMTNLLPNEIYKEVLCPAEIQHGMPIEYKKVLRIFCREKQPVGGISVKEHFEINLVPLTIGLTKKFYGTMMKFCFPERENESVGGGPSTATTSEYSGQDNSSRMGEDTASEMSEGGSTKTAAATATRKSTKAKRNRQNSNFYIHTDDVEKMKERAEKNKLFVYIKIPEVPVKVSYKGNKEKNLEDLRDVSLVIPTLEYHNMTWTWLDLLMAVRNDSKRVILSQAIKQKLQIKRNTVSLDLGSSSSPQEEDKARMLFGARHAPENKSMRKGVGGVFKFGK